MRYRLTLLTLALMVCPAAIAELDMSRLESLSWAPFLQLSEGTELSSNHGLDFMSCLGEIGKFADTINKGNRIVHLHTFGHDQWLNVDYIITFDCREVEQ